MGDCVTFLPRHSKQEIKTGTLKSILKDLNLKM
ncbi:MAG: type II toxin-antitoxin system HicA family toxin [Bryobacterales bacterium]|nr:type II toxin-antitoxin system HicA family toxin [Bryobacterales bacterium]